MKVGVRKTGAAEELVSKPTLAEAGIDKKLSSRAQKLHAISAVDFDVMVNNGREAIARGVERNAIKAIEIAEARAGYEARAERGGIVADLEVLAASGNL